MKELTFSLDLSPNSMLYDDYVDLKKQKQVAGAIYYTKNRQVRVCKAKTRIGSRLYWFLSSSSLFIQGGSGQSILVFTK